MAVNCGRALLLLLVVATSMFAIAAANKDWSTIAGNWNHTGANVWGYHPKNATQATSNRIVVGGSEHWRFGFNYTDWSIKNGPFYLNDTLGNQFNKYF